MQPIYITGIGAYLPRTMHGNDTLPPFDPPLCAEEIARIGVHRRGWAAPDEGIAEMAAHAGSRALAAAGMEAAALDLVVLANWTQRRYLPDFAPHLQQLLGAHRAAAFDVGTACAGFVYGIAIAHSFLQNPRFSRAMVAASETTSHRGRPGSKSRLIFGDGAGAVVLERGASRGAEVLDYELGTDGRYHGMMAIDDRGFVKTQLPQKQLNELAARSFAEPCRALLGRAGLSMADVDWVVPHPGTAGIQATLIRSLDVPPEKVLTNFDCVGNVSSAAIPVALQQFVEAGRVRAGDLVLSPTTGSGWYSAALLYRMGAL